MENTNTEFTLDGAQPAINKDALYLVDFSSFKSVEDLVLVFASMGLSFSGSHPQFDSIKHLLDLNNPVLPNGGVPTQPGKPNLKMPKLKSIK